MVSLLTQLDGRVIILEFQEIIYRSSNLGGHLCCSHGWGSDHW